MSRSDAIKQLSKSTANLAVNKFEKAMKEKDEKNLPVGPEDLFNAIEEEVAKICAAYEQNLAFYHTRFSETRKILAKILNTQKKSPKSSEYQKAIKEGRSLLITYKKEDESINERKEEVQKEYEKMLKEATDGSPTTNA